MYAHHLHLVGRMRQWLLRFQWLHRHYCGCTTYTQSEVAFRSHYYLHLSNYIKRMTTNTCEMSMHIYESWICNAILFFIIASAKSNSEWTGPPVSVKVTVSESIAVVPPFFDWFDDFGELSLSSIFFILSRNPIFFFSPWLIMFFELIFLIFLWTNQLYKSFCFPRATSNYHTRHTIRKS